MAQATLFVEIVPTTTGVKRNIEKDLDGSFSTAEKKGTSVFGKIGKLAKGAALAAAGAAAALTGLAIKGGFERMLKIEDATKKLEGLGHSTANVETIMGSALAAVKGTAFGLDTAATVAASAVAAGIKPGQELEKYLRLTADAATIAGVSMDEMGSIMNKVQANGRAMTENLNQLQDRGIPILQWLADEYGVTAAEMSKMVSQGKVDAETFNRVIEENIGGAALKAGESTRGAFANMMAAINRLGERVLQDIFPLVQPALSAITRALDTMTDKVGPVIERLSTGFRALKEGMTFDGDVDTLALGPFLSTFVKIGQAVSEVTGGFRAMFEAFKAGGRDVTSSGLAGFMETVGLGARALFDAFKPLFSGGLGELLGYLTPLGAVFKLLGPLLPQLVAPLGQIAEVFAGALASYLPIVAEVFAKIGEVLGGVLLAVIPVVADILGRLAGVFERMMPVVLVIAGIIADVLVSALDLLMPVVSVVLSLLDPLFSIFEAIIPPILAIAQALLPVVGILMDAFAPILITVVQIIGTALAPVLETIAAILTFVGGVITWLVQNIVVPYFTKIMAPAIRVVGDIFTTVFGGLGDFFAGIWRGIETGFKAFVNFIIDGINGFIDGLNGMGGFLSDITGGAIDFRIGKLPRLALGGVVEATPGGVAAVVGEGRYDEAVLPLGGPQLERVRAALGRGSSDRPIYMDGTLFGWVQEIANSEAKLVVNKDNRDQARRLDMGWQF
ncbi:tape measure protein [Ruicaihuangia caeni]|uniref:Tape measure protein n=1 Tax=Ruicaihuangia caeni TaxID=3042517 RepID=A0AAW6T9F8_9MICO|nr:tape measure protein [Klugiella sp. YN-L-19]MDI2097995.1 tape measure protein [Klugiella sp. YN-L-19]